MQLEIRIARKTEIGQALTLLKDAALWLKSKNVNYWQTWINPEKIYVDWIEEGFEMKQFYFVLNNSKVIGMFRLQWDDEMFWGKQKNNAGYIHSFTIDRALYGQGIGKKVLVMIEELCIRNDKQYLRLDCGVHVLELCRFYKNSGFSAIGVIELFKERLCLFEKRIFDTSGLNIPYYEPQEFSAGVRH